MANEIAKKLGLKPEQFVAVVKALGLEMIEQSGFYKVQGQKLEGEKESQYRLYIAKGKVCTRVDLSGFTAEFGAQAHSNGTFGNVSQELAWPEEATAEDILRTFGALCEHMMTLEPVKPEKKAAKSKAPKNAGAEVKTEDVIPQDEESKAARLARIRKAAESMGVPVSPKTEAELAPSEENTAPTAEA